MPRARRLNPPRLDWTPELEWLFLRAFGPVGQEVPAGNQRLRLDCAYRAGLARRVASRQLGETLVRELGERAAAQLVALLRQQVARGLAVLETERLCSRLAGEEEIACVLLKFAALQRLGAVDVALRGSVDLDLLIDEGDVAKWSSCLQASGGSLVSHWVPGYHPAVFRSRVGVNVELHVRLPYVRTHKDGCSATLGELQQSGLVAAVGADTPRVLVPKREFLIAHLVAHALVQHGYAPDAYPPLRILADLCDLEFTEGEATADGVGRWLCDGMGSDELQGLRELTAACRSGRVSEQIGSNSPSERMLRHLLGCVFDLGYRRQLRLRRLGQVISEQGSWGTVGHLLRAVMRRVRPEVH